MKKMFLTALLAVFMMSAYSFADSQAVMPWRVARDYSATDDTALVAATKTWALRPASCKELYDRAKNIGVAFRHSETDATAVYKIYVYRSGGDAELVCTGTVTGGAMVSGFGGFWADTITVTDTWVTGVEVSNASAGDEMATLWFDALGSLYLYVEMTSISGTTVAGAYYTYVD